MVWDDLRVLLAVYRRGSFLAAGRDLGLSTSTVARRIDELEQKLGRALVHRTTTGASVEPAALALITLAEQLEQGLAAALRDSSDSGVVRVSVGVGFARATAQVLADWQRSHPQVHLELEVSARPADLAKREADLGLRTVRSPSNVLIEKRLGTLRFGLFASRSYVERRLRDARLSRGDFARHDFVSHEGAQRKLPMETWLVEHGAQRFPFRASSDDALLEVALRGQGIAMLGRPEGAAHPELVELEPVGCEALPKFDVFLVMHRELRTVPRVRLVAQALEAGVGARLGAVVR